ncbi:MAG: hypothetical protein QXR09_03835 [Candidatus Aenigmatarchaeota archaeon]
MRKSYKIKGNCVKKTESLDVKNLSWKELFPQKTEEKLGNWLRF